MRIRETIQGDVVVLQVSGGMFACAETVDTAVASFARNAPAHSHKAFARSEKKRPLFSVPAGSRAVPACGC